MRKIITENMCVCIAAAMFLVTGCGRQPAAPIPDIKLELPKITPQNDTRLLPEPAETVAVTVGDLVKVEGRYDPDFFPGPLSVILIELRREDRNRKSMIYRSWEASGTDDGHFVAAFEIPDEQGEFDMVAKAIDYEHAFIGHIRLSIHSPPAVSED